MSEFSSVNDQGSFLNSCAKTISPDPVLDLAYLSNTIDNTESDLILNLNPVCLTWCDFMNLFFASNSGAFWINPSGSNSCVITLNSQTYESTQNKCIQFNLAEQIKKAWAQKNSKLESQIPPQYNLILNKQVFYLRTLAASKYAVGLGLDQAISTLLANNQIAPADSESCARVKFTISFRYYFAPLETSVLANFNYITKIPCFKNTGSCDFCPYTKDNQNCRACFDIKDDNTITSFLNENQLNHYEEYNLDANSQLNGDKSETSSVSNSHYLTNVLDIKTKGTTIVSDNDSSTW